MKFASDRRRYLQWVFEAKKRYGLRVLGYAVTSNHVHLLVRDKGHRDVIPKSIQLVAGRTGQEFNKRKNRKGAYWEDRYHATAIEADKHLFQSLVYIDLHPAKCLKEDRFHYTYVLQSEIDGNFYAGYTKNLKLRPALLNDVPS